MTSKVSENYKFFQNSQKTYLIASLIYVTFLTISSNRVPEDISVARESFARETPSDFLGTFAGLVYSLIPDWPFGWARSLTMVQVTLALIGLRSLFSKSSRIFEKNVWAIFLIQYLVAIFSAQQSRDGTLFSLTLFGFGLTWKSLTSSKLQKFLFLIGLSIIVLGTTFRPVLSLSSVIVFLFLVKVLRHNYKLHLKNLIVLAATIVITVLPTSIELLLSKQLVDKSSYPIQTIFIQDLGFAACQSANVDTVSRSLSGLSIIAIDEDFNSRICQFYRINTWQSLPGFVAPNPTTEALRAPIRLIASKNEFQSLFRSWVETSILDPKTYIQGKLISLSQVLFSSQTSIGAPLDSLSSSSPLSQLVEFFRWIGFFLHLPWITLSKLYVLSPGMVLLSSLVLNRILKNKLITLNSILWPIPFIAWSAIAVNSIFFVSDNARYTTTYSIFVFIAYIVAFSRKEKDWI